MATEVRGLVTINTGFRPQIQQDSAVVLRGMGITDIALIGDYHIKSDRDYIEVGNLIVTAATAAAQITEAYKAEKGKAFEAHKAVCANEKSDLAPWLKIREIGDREIKAWQRKKDQERRAEEERQRQQVAEAERVARAEAQRIEQEAQEEARRLQQAGEVRASREAVQEAQQKAAEVIQQATALAEVGMIIPDSTPKVDGLGGSFRWKGREVQNEQDLDAGIMQVIKAIASGKVPLRHLTPVRGGAPEMRRLVDLDATVVNEIATRCRQENIGVPGLEGFKDYSSRVVGLRGWEPVHPIASTDSWE